MNLLIRRSQRDDGIIWSSTMFELDARLDLSLEETYLIDKYQIAQFVVYDSDARNEHADAAYQHFDDATKTPLWNPSLSDLASSLWSNIAAVGHGLMMAYSLRITVADLIAGTHVECDDLSQILTTEKVISEACEHLAHYIETAGTFDGGEEL